MSAQPWDCQSCGAQAQKKPFCEQCGAAQPFDSQDSALSMMLGLVCERCDGYNDPGVDVCASCGAPLAAEAPLAAPAAALSAADLTPPSWMTPPTGQPIPSQFALPKVDLSTVATGAEGAGVAAPQPPRPLPRPAPDDTSGPAARATPMPSPAAAVSAGPTATPLSVPRAQLCWRCGSALSTDDKFCRNCGARAGEAPSATATTQIAQVKPNLPSPVLPPNATMVMPAMRAAQQAGQQSGAQPSATMFFGAATAERTAKLVLVRGQSQFGSQWRLQAGETVVGRSEGMVLFPDDEALAPRHCRLVFRGADLWLEPEPTLNGVFVRVRDPVALVAGDEIVVGAQRLQVLPDDERPVLVQADPSTRILGSMVKPATPIVLMRIGSTPAQNEVFYRCQRLLTLGRNHCDVNFPRDSFVSERHAQVSREDNGLILEDLRSRNGTYVRALAPAKLAHGDLVLLGDKVLRVELPR